MGTISVFLAIFFLQLQIWSVRSQITIFTLIYFLGLAFGCQICGPGVGPNYGCDSQTAKNTDKNQPGCTHCAIWEEWGLNSDKEWRMLERKRICLVGEQKIGCTYWYPAGTRGYVHEICKCSGRTCNRDLFTPNPRLPNTNITTLGGLGHPSKFPPQKRNGEVVLKVVNVANPQVNGVLHWSYFLVPLFLLSFI